MARPSQDPCIPLLRDLVAIDSVNPTLVPGASGEGAIAAAIAEHMRLLGLDVTVQEVATGTAERDWCARTATIPVRR